MADNNASGYGCSLWGLALPVFFVIKMFGTAFVAWSWWWVLLSIVPVLWLILTRFGLMN